MRVAASGGSAAIAPAQRPVAPIIKWVGGKRQLLPELIRRLPTDYAERRHVELFAGGAALFFARAPKRALLSDSCEPLMRMYRAVRDNPEAVIRSLRAKARKDCELYYYDVRDQFNRGIASDVGVASAMLYLNRAGFNGLFRCNRFGAYNVPYGHRTAESICQTDLIRAAVPLLKNANVVWSDYPDVAVAYMVGRGDFVYLDPPYVPICHGKTTSFTAYGASDFHYEDHVRLRDLAEKLERAGAKVMVSNSDTPFTRDVWRRWRIDTVECQRNVAGGTAGRGKAREVIIRGYGDEP